MPAAQQVAHEFLGAPHDVGTGQQQEHMGISWLPDPRATRPGWRHIARADVILWMNGRLCMNGSGAVDAATYAALAVSLPHTLCRSEFEHLAHRVCDEIDVIIAAGRSMPGPAHARRDG